MKPYVYLCGPICGLSDDAATNWRNKAQSLLHPEFKSLSPLRGYRGSRFAYKDREIITRDLMDIRKSRAVLRYYPGGSSEGSAQETFYANQVIGIPVVLWGPGTAALLRPRPDQEVSRWLRAHTSSAHDTLEEAVEYLKSWWIYPGEQRGYLPGRDISDHNY